MSVGIRTATIILSAKQSAFVEEYALCRNAAKAARAAGYAPGSARVTGSRLLSYANVSAALAEREGAIARDLRMTRQTVLAALQEAIGLARMQENPTAMIAGWREIAKMCGYYAPETKRIELSAEHEALRARYEAMADEELLLLIEGGNA